jgi:hypothetical protein
MQVSPFALPLTFLVVAVWAAYFEMPNGNRMRLTNGIAKMGDR